MDEPPASTSSTPQTNDGPARAWFDALHQLKQRAKEDAVAFNAAGVSFYLLLAFVPTLAAVASIYGLAVEESTVVQHVAVLDGVVPEEIVTFIQTELASLASSGSSAGRTLVISLLLAIWSSSRAVEALTIALNHSYDEPETRSFLKRRLNSIALTAGFLVFLALLLLLLVAVPVVTAFAGMNGGSDKFMAIGRWPLLLLAALLAITALYRFAPCHKNPRWPWFTAGSWFAAISWLIVSLGLTLYTTEIGWSTKTYGSIGVVILLMLFFYLLTIAVLIGGMINSLAEDRHLEP